MKILTIDTQNNCYVIDPNGMNHLQQNVASSLTLDKGTFDIKINSGRYSYAQSKTEGEPLVVLWIYGVDGSTFVNKNTGNETGATWTSLNGYNKKLQLEVKEKAVICALFFDVNNSDNKGTVNLLISSNKPFFNSQTLTVDSKRNCYVLDEGVISNLKQSNSNFIELEPGNYKIKIRESNATYWSSEQKFKLEPWALLWIKGGKFVSNLTSLEVEETWCSLNGLQDEFILEVKEKTTILGFFFDTYKEDNKGQVVLEINTVSEAQVNQKYKEQGLQVTVVTDGNVNESNVTVVNAGGGTSTGGTGSAISGGGVSLSGEKGFSFSFDEEQMEQMWQEMAARIENSVTVTDEKDENKQAYWDSLEKSILKSYQSQAKKLAIQVARLEFMMKTLTQQMEGNFNHSFQAWSNYFNKNLNDLFISRVPRIISDQVNLTIAEQTQEVKNLVIQQMQTELNERVESVVNLKINNITQEIKTSVVQQMQTELEQRIENVVNVKIANQSQEINTQVVNQISNDIDQRIDNVVNVKISNQSQQISNQVLQQIQFDIDQRIDNVVSLKISDQTQNVKNLVIQQMQNYVEERIDNVVNIKIANQAQEISTQVIQQIQSNIDKRIDAVVNIKIANQNQTVKNLVVKQIESDMGFSRFKSRGRMRSFVFPQMLKNCVNGISIKLPQLGEVEFIKSRNIPDGFVVKQARIVSKASGYFILLALEYDVKVPDIVPSGYPIGIDLGLEHFLATSEGELVERPRFFVERQRQLKLLQRRLKHKTKGSNNRRKLNKKIARLHQKNNDTRKDFHFKLAHKLCDQAGMIFVEDINFQVWAKGMLGKHTLDAGFGQFLIILQWVCWKRGVYFAKVDKDFTSQVCPNCDTHTGKKDLSIRIHTCPECGYTTNRDVAAAQVIRNRGVLAVGRIVSLQNACGDGLAGTGDSLVKSRRSKKKGYEARIKTAS